MQYEGTIIRPPSEAHSIIFQVTAGCSHNTCSFCGAYKDKRFRIRLETLDEDIAFAKDHCQNQNRVFLADGDALILPSHTLERILEKIRLNLPWVNRVSLYANCRAIRSKTGEQLQTLKDLGLDRVYMGLESGHDEVLKNICKGETASSMIEASRAINKAGLFLSVTVLLGIAGTKLSCEHAEATGSVLTMMKPRQIAALTVMPIPGTGFYEQVKNGIITLPSPSELLNELRLIIQFIQCDRVQFFANHASNYLPLSGRLQKDKKRMLEQIDGALNGTVRLVPDELRAL